MYESIFFNLGNMFAEARDVEELKRTEQVEYDHRKLRGRLTIINDPEKGERLLLELFSKEQLARMDREESAQTVIKTDDYTFLS